MKNLIKIIMVIFLVSLFDVNAYSAGSDGGSKVKKENKYDFNYKKAKRLIKKAKKLEKKGKTEKAKENYKEALESLLLTYTDRYNDPDVLNYLGFTSRKTDDFKNAETYYLMGLKIDPNHNGINEYLGELYVQTNRMDKAKERLSVLKNCNCEEYTELKDLIEGKKESKY